MVNSEGLRYVYLVTDVLHVSHIACRRGYVLLETCALGWISSNLLQSREAEVREKKKARHAKDYWYDVSLRSHVLPLFSFSRAE